MPTFSQHADFISEVIPKTLLDDAIEWIQRNLDPDQVFEKDQLRYWAEKNGYIEKD